MLYHMNQVALIFLMKEMFTFNKKKLTIPDV